MSTTQNKDIVLRQWYQELWDKWDVNVADELCTADYRLHLPGSAAAVDRDTTKGVIKMFSVAFPDLRHTVEEMVAEGDTVAARWSVRGTHRGDFQGIAPTGKQVNVSGTTVHHMLNGQIGETWLTFDTMDLLQQLGAVPRPVEAVEGGRG
jgi:steroid delta-isomerase-like uncharacterized protein